MSLYNPTSKTVVTEIKSFLVDSVRKVSTVQNTVSAKIEDDQIVTQRDINVGATHVDLGLINKHLIVSSVKPLELELTQTSEILTYPVITHTAIISVPTSLYEDHDLSIVITDQDSVALATVQVLVTNNDTGEEETVILSREPNTARFSGVLPLASAGTITSEDGSMTAFQGQFLTLSYVDQENSTGVTQTITQEVSIIPNPTYTASLKLAQFVPGSPLLATIYDANSQVSISANIFNERTLEQEVISLTETLAGSGVFQGSIATLDDLATGTDNDQVLNCRVSDVISLSYDDPANSGGLTQTLSSSIQIGTETFTSGQLSALPVRPGEPLVINVEDTDQSSQVVVTVTNETTGEIETLNCTEISPLSGTFRGVLDTVLGTTVWYAGTNNDGSINVKAGDVLTVRYNDSTDINGLPLLIQTQLNVGPELPGPTVPDPIISYEDQVINLTTKLLVIDGTVGITRLRLRKPDSNTDQYVRAQVFIA